MKSPMRFRTRVTLLATAMAAVLSLLFAWASIYITEDYEHVLVEAILDSLAQDYSERLAVAPATPLPRTRRLQGFAASHPHPDSPPIPPELRGLEPGIHESATEDVDGVHIGVFDTRAGRLYFQIDLSGIEELEVHLRVMLLVIVAGGIAIGAWLGWLVARAASRPIAGLADKVEALPPEPTETAFAAMLPPDELGRLGASVDGYQARLVAAAAAEQAFFADASHELRTPLSVLGGAIELLQEDIHGVPGAKPRLERVERGVVELSELVEALFRLARRQIRPDTQVDLGAWLRDTAKEALRRHAPDVEVVVKTDGETVDISPRDAELVTRTLVRRLVPPGASGALAVSAAAGRATFSHVTGGPLTQIKPSAARFGRGDRGLGMSLMGRLAHAMGWFVDESQRDNGTVQVRWQGDRQNAREPS